MEQYQGSMDINPLFELADRRLYRANILTRILLSDLNMDRDKLVGLAKRFAKEKPKRLPEILAARTPDPLKVVTPKKRTRACPKTAQIAPKRQRKSVAKK
ncbi:unnamed protein product [Amaranthus hypochondriacus]